MHPGLTAVILEFSHAVVWLVWPARSEKAKFLRKKQPFGAVLNVLSTQFLIKIVIRNGMNSVFCLFLRPVVLPQLRIAMTVVYWQKLFESCR